MVQSKRSPAATHDQELYRPESVARIPFQWIQRQFGLAQEEFLEGVHVGETRAQIVDYLIDLCDSVCAQAVQYERIREISVGSLDELALKLDTPRNLQDWLAQMVGDSLIIAIDVDGVDRYPLFQFGHDLQVEPNIVAINAALNAVDDPEGALCWWVEPSIDLDGLSPLNYFELFGADGLSVARFGLI